MRLIAEPWPSSVHAPSTMLVASMLHDRQLPIQRAAMVCCSWLHGTPVAHICSTSATPSTPPSTWSVSAMQSPSTTSVACELHTLQLLTHRESTVSCSWLHAMTMSVSSQKALGSGYSPSILHPSSTALVSASSHSCSGIPHFSVHSLTTDCCILEHGPGGGGAGGLVGQADVKLDRAGSPLDMQSPREESTLATSHCPQSLAHSPAIAN